MSDNRTRYRGIRDSLEKLYPKQPQGNLARHLNTLAAMINGIVGSKSCQLSKIAGKTPLGVKPESVAKRIKRFIDNDSIEQAVFFLPYAQALLFSLGLTEIVLVIDGSIVGRGCVTLMVSVIYKKRALPLAYIVVKGKKGHFPEQSHIELLKEVHKMIPESTKRVIFLGDGEFDGVDLQKTLNDWGWFYVCRTGTNIKIFLDGEEYDLPVISFLLLPGSYMHVRNVSFTHQQYGPVMVVAWWAENNEKLIYLVTNMQSPEDACHYYSKRYRIETFFSDQKSRGFNIHKSHISDPVRLHRLMMAACLAYIWIVYLGVFAVKYGWNKIIHRSDRCDLSLFQLGLKLLDHFLDYDLAIPVDFRIGNLSNC
jgi:hypothetical protein